MTMFCAPVSGTEIYDIVNRMHNNRSPEPDNIGSWLINEIILVIINPLLYLFISDKYHQKWQRWSLFTRKATDVLLTITALSLLNVFDKILERIKYVRL